MKKGDIVQMIAGEDYHNKYLIHDIFRSENNPDDSFAQVSYVGGMNEPRTALVPLFSLKQIAACEEKK